MPVPFLPGWSPLPTVHGATVLREGNSGKAADRASEPLADERSGHLPTKEPLWAAQCPTARTRHSSMPSAALLLPIQSKSGCLRLSLPVGVCVALPTGPDIF